MRLSEVAGLVLAIVALGGWSSASAQDKLSPFQGAWLAGEPDCATVFSSSGKGIMFKKPVNLFVPAFIISGNRLRTPQASCRIASVRPNGDRQLMILDCANSVAGSEVRVLIAARPDGSLRRYFDEQDTDGTQYLRCSP